MKQASTEMVNRVESLPVNGFGIHVSRPAMEPVIEVYLEPRKKGQAVVRTNLATTLIKNTPDDGLVGMLEQGFIRANKAVGVAS